MKKTYWQITQVVIFPGLVFLLFCIVFSSFGREAWFVGLAMVYAPVSALLYGVSGLRIYGKDSGNKEDRFNTMNLWLSIGLLMLGFAEIAITLVRLSLDLQQMTLIIALVHLPGLLLWGIGALQYLRSLNSSLDLVDENKLWTSIFFTTTLSILGLIVATTIQLPSIDFAVTIVLSPVIIGLALFSITTTGLVWVFRKGELAKPLFFFLSAILLFLLRTCLWLFTDTSLGSAFDGLIAIESFTLCGGAILLARNLGSTDTN